MRDLNEILNDKRVRKIYKNVQTDKILKIKMEVHTFKGSDKALVSFTRVIGWEHLSVSFPNKIPSWEVMNEMKEMFFKDDEDAFQYHPKKENYINNNEYTLHIWRPLETDIPVPPSILVGFRDGHWEEDREAAKKLHEELDMPLSDQELKLLEMTCTKEGKNQLEEELRKMSPSEFLVFAAKFGVI